MLVSFQAFTQSIMFHQKVNSVVLYRTLEVSDAEHPVIYKFLDEKIGIPIQVNDSTWRINVPPNQFTMILIDNKEWIGIKPNGTKIM